MVIAITRSGYIKRATGDRRTASSAAAASA